ncbi:MAG: hypothetical protein ACPG05_03110 [Bdellovibrionales bacterium]
MGSLVSKPKAPRTQTIIQQVPATNTVSEARATEAVEEKSSDILSSEARSENLLRRNRGTFGTILTGFRGVLSANEGQQKRKTLLGE